MYPGAGCSHMKKHAFLAFVIPRKPAHTFELESCSKSVSKLFEFGLYPPLISLEARELCGKGDSVNQSRKADAVPRR